MREIRITKETHLDQEVEMSEVIIAARWRVTTHDILSIDLSRHGYMLAYG